MASLGLTVGTIGLGLAIVVSADLLRTAEHIQRSADLTALAASDVSIGVVPGEPCSTARSVARANGAELVDCDADAGQVTVVVALTRHGIRVHKVATAAAQPHPLWLP